MSKDIIKGQLLLNQALLNAILQRLERYDIKNRELLIDDLLLIMNTLKKY